MSENSGVTLCCDTCNNEIRNDQRFMGVGDFRYHLTDECSPDTHRSKQPAVKFTHHESSEKCTNGEKHDFSGDMVYFTPDGYETTDPNESSSGSVLCRRCGLDAMSHSMRYRP